MIKVCSDISTNFDDIEVGEAVWCEGHIGVYIGNGLAVECTPAWKNCVQITACNCNKAGYDTRKWTKHGKLPYIDYSVPKPPKNEAEPAEKYDKTLAGSYKVNAVTGLNIRSGAGIKKKSLGVLKNDTIVKNYGYYSNDKEIATSKVK